MFVVLKIMLTFNILYFLQISEAMDIRTRQGLLNALVGRVGKRMDALLVPLELLCCVSRAEFSDKKAYLRWQKRQASYPVYYDGHMDTNKIISLWS